MNPRYQIFISSTFRDLETERQSALEAILELGHFPAGMEVFPAANATPWALIETIINESDYYVVIIGGMYGSTDASGVSYTEKEYDFATARGLPILAFLHKNPSAIPAGKSELSPESRQRLEAFRQKVQTHHCKHWESADELKAQVVIGLTHAMRVNPRIGWIRSDRPENPETLKKLTSAMEENAQLHNQIKELREAIGGRSIGGEGIASGSDTVTLKFTSSNGMKVELKTTWDSIFLGIGSCLMSECPDWALQQYYAQFLVAEAVAKELLPAQNVQYFASEVDRADYSRVVLQFIALDYVEPLTIVSQTTTFDRPDTRREQGFRLTKLGARIFATKQAMRKPSLP